MSTRSAELFRGGRASCLAAAIRGGGRASCLAAAAVCVTFSAQAKERVHYIAAETILWDYAPSFPTNLMTGTPFTAEESIYLEPGKGRIGRRNYKAVYREYTDGTFSKPLPRDESLGILGPILHAEVGDTITVHFRNDTALSVGMHPHGVFYDKANEGAHYASGDPRQHLGAHVKPLGGEYTYRWQVPERAGPGPADPDSIFWLYHAHDHEDQDVYAGLVGGIVVTRKGKALPDGRPRDVDRELVMLFMIFDENKSAYLRANIEEFAEGRVWDPDDAAHEAEEKVDAESQAFRESNKKHAINGLLWGNLGGLVMKKGERVRWYLIGLGNESDIHTAHWHGATVLHHGARTDTVGLLPATTEVVDMRPDDAGTWMFHCHVADHMAGGMMTRYTVLDASSEASHSRVRSDISAKLSATKRTFW